MANNRITRIIQQAYGKRFDMPDPNAGVARRPIIDLSRLYPAADAFRNNWVVLSLITTMLILAGATIYYYNRLTDEYNSCHAAYAQVEALMQRRNDVSITMANAVQDYSLYEREILKKITELRAGFEKAPPNNSEPNTAASGDGGAKKAADAARAGIAGLTADAASPLGRLIAVAESNPDLKASVTFQALMASVVEVEKDLAEKRVAYNSSVSLYTTEIRLFPNIIFAWLFSFPDMRFFEATEEAQNLRRVLKNP